jgi:hypothetical protein
MYVQLRAIKDVIIEGNVARCHPGDWVEVGKQTALAWVAAGDAWVPEEKLAGTLPADSGVLIVGDESARKQIGHLVDREQVRSGERALPFSHTLLWTPTAPFPRHLLAAGFHLLRRWQIVVPLWSYEELATTAGTEEARAVALDVLHDLRVPLYETRVIFARRLAVTRKLIDRWESWLEELRDDRLAFLCAVYECKPVICALPALDRRPG